MILLSVVFIGSAAAQTPESTCVVWSRAENRCLDAPTASTCIVWSRAANRCLDAPTEAEKASAPASQQITSTYDRINNYTRVALDRMSLGRLELQASFMYPGTTFTAPSKVFLHFSQQSATWNYLKYRPLRLLLDDTTRLDLGSVTHDGSVGQGYVLEQMFAEVPVSRLQQILAAETVEGQLGTTPFKLTPSQLNALRVFARRMVPSRPQ